MQKLVPLSKVKPNPFRRLERYPLRQEKIAALEVSINETGFWDNVVAREVDGFYELAYGHHRRVAFENVYGKDAKIMLIIMDISDDNMLRIMANENMKEWGSDALIEQETIRSVVMAYAEGKLDDKDRGMKKPKPSGRDKNRYVGLRLAPSFLLVDFNTVKVQKMGLNGPFYNAETIADFLGWKQPDGQPSHKVRSALTALEAREMKLVSAEDMKGLNTNQAKALVEGAKKIQKRYKELEGDDPDSEEAVDIRKRSEQEIKKAAKLVSGAVNVLGVKGIKEELERLAHTIEKEKSKLPVHVMDFCVGVALEIDKALNVKYTSWKMLDEIVKHKDEIDPEAMRNLTSALGKLAKRGQKLIEDLKPTPAYKTATYKVSTTT